MGPLFSLALVAIALGVGMLVAFLVAMLFLRPFTALVAAALFITAAPIGATAAALMLAFFIGVGTTLTSGWHVLAYLSSLALSGLLSGTLVVWLYLSWLRSNKTIEPTR